MLIFVMNFLSCFLLLFLWILVNIGINVCVNVFLVNRWWRKLGILLVKKNMLVVVLLFISLVIIILCIKFNICEIKVIILMIRLDFINFCDMLYF